jgi:hypothetical protein
MKLKKLVAAIALAVSSLSAQADITDGKFGTGQLFDVQYYWSQAETPTTPDYNCYGVNTCEVLHASGFTRVYSDSGQLSTQDYTTMQSTGQYFGLFDSTTHPGEYGLAIYNSDGTVSRILHTYGTVSAIGPDAIFYIGSGFNGTVISTTTGYALGSSATFSNMNTSVTSTDLTNYSYTTTTPLAAGETASSTPSAPSAPTVVSTAPGTPVTTSTTTDGTTVTTTAVTRGDTVVATTITDSRGAQDSKSLTINRNTTVISATPVTTVVTETTPYTTVSTTTTTVVETLSDGTTRTVDDTTTVTTTTGDNIVTTTTVTTDTTTDSSDQAYSTRIDQYTKLLDANQRMNETLESDPLTRIKISANGIQQRDLSGRDYNFYITGNGLQSNTSDGYNYRGGIFGIGIEKVINASTLVGIKYDRSQTTLSGDNAGGSLTKDSVGIYAVNTVNNWILKSDAGYAMNTYGAQHSIPELGYGNTSSTKGADKWAQIKLYTPDYKGFRPLVGARIENNQINSVTESGSAITAMSYDAVNQSRTVGLVGARYDYNFNKNWAVGVEAIQNTAQTTQANLALTYFDDKNSSVLLKVGTQNNNGVTVNTATVQARLRF